MNPTLKKIVDKKLIGLVPKAYRKHIQHYLDCDYIDELDDLDKMWLAKFLNEFYNNNVKKDDPRALHNTDELRKDCYARTNAMNRDISNMRSYHRNQLPAEPYEPEDPTDAYIEWIDSLEKLED